MNKIKNDTKFDIVVTIMMNITNLSLGSFEDNTQEGVKHDVGHFEIILVFIISCIVSYMINYVFVLRTNIRYLEEKLNKTDEIIYSNNELINELDTTILDKNESLFDFELLYKNIKHNNVILKNVIKAQKQKLETSEKRLNEIENLLIAKIKNEHGKNIKKDNGNWTAYNVYFDLYEGIFGTFNYYKHMHL